MDKLIFHPIISSIQKIILYETKSKFYLVGTNNTQTRFRVLKIDRMEPRELLIHDDKVEYTKNEIHNLVNMIDSGNRQKSGSGFSNITSAFGIVGFIRFLEGYYIILVTKRRKAAVIGYHTIYKIECTSMIYIPHDSVRLLHPDEPRYYKMFQGVDLSSNFYFSYSYDITHTLQHNMAAPRRIVPNHEAAGAEGDRCDTSGDIGNDDDDEDDAQPPLFPDRDIGAEVHEYAVRAKPNRRFVWNSHLVRCVERYLHPDWLLWVVHGFVGQANVCIFGRPVYVTLLARRSSRYAGTRFLKRGANSSGDVANEVETEQIVHDSAVSSLYRSHVTAFVQMRGSIPGQWRQDMGKMAMAKPAIVIDLHDPFAEVAGAHFADLLHRYGAPILILNLVKRRETKPQERLLSDELVSSIRYLNQFLPAGDHQLQYRAFDMARKNKSSATDVMAKLAGIARAAVARTGVYHKGGGSGERLQKGVVRTNCVDCLDRTNTAQFALGKCALGVQLCALGVLAAPTLHFDSDCVRMLESLYEDHGDTLALQYGGSQLVHRVRTYRKTAPWTSHGNDIMQTLSRYYSNTFSDADKQCSMNLFLGLYEPSGQRGALWEMASDHYLHHKVIPIPRRPSATQWWGGEVVWASLPLPLHTQRKAVAEVIRILDGATTAEMVDAFADYHRPYELSALADLYAFQLDHSVRDYMPSGTIDCSPFRVRARPGRRREGTATSTQAAITNPSLSGLSSSSSATSSNSSSTDDEAGGSDEEEESGAEEDDQSQQMGQQQQQQQQVEQMSFSALFPPFDVVYGVELAAPNKVDMVLYKRYVLIGKKANGTSALSASTNLIKSSGSAALIGDTSFNVNVPRVPQNALAVYDNYIQTGVKGGNMPTQKNLNMYKQYVSLR